MILAEAHGRRPEFVDLKGPAGASAEARLLIGDKVVCAEPARSEFPHQIDLGQACPIGTEKTRIHVPKLMKRQIR